MLFSGGTVSGCGPASSATGPFYCPRDGKVYLDLSFFRELRSRFGAPGRLRAGIRDRTRVRPPRAEPARHQRGGAARGSSGTRERERALGPARAAGRLPRRRLGAFGLQRENLLEPGDVEEGLAAAAAVGDDRIQASTQGRIDPETLDARHRRSSARPGSGGGSTPGTRTDATRSRATSEVDDELDPRVIVDFDFERGLLFVAVRNLGDRPAYRVSTTFDKPFRGLGGRREMNALRLFRGIEFLAPRKEIRALARLERRLLRAQGARQADRDGLVPPRRRPPPARARDHARPLDLPRSRLRPGRSNRCLTASRTAASTSASRSTGSTRSTSPRSRSRWPSIAVVEYREGGDRTSATRKLPGRVALRQRRAAARHHGRPSRSPSWFRAELQGDHQPRNVLIVLQDAQHQDVRRWRRPRRVDRRSAEGPDAGRERERGRDRDDRARLRERRDRPTRSRGARAAPRRGASAAAP